MSACTGGWTSWPAPRPRHRRQAPRKQENELALLSIFGQGGEPEAPAPTGAALARAQAVRQQLTLWGALWAGFGILAFMPLVWYIVHQGALRQQFQTAAGMQLAASQ